VRRVERQADADLIRASRHGVREHSVQAGCRQQERERSERAEDTRDR
jgi:hypothetical protein